MKKLISVIMLCILCVLTASCTTGNNAGKTLSERILLDYETRESVVNYSVSGAQFGTKDINYDKTYVSRGSSSMKLVVDDMGEGNISVGKAYYSGYIAYNDLTKLGHDGDFSRTNDISVDVYNNSDRDTKIRLILTSNVGSQGYTIDLGFAYALKNQWNKCTFPISIERWAHSGINSVLSLTFVFDGYVKGQSNLELYFDALRVTEYGAYSVKEVEMPPQSDMFCSFESEYFLNNMTTTGSLPITKIPSISINDNQKYVSEGTKSLKIVRYGTNVQEESYRKFSYIYFPEEYVAAFDFSRYQPGKYKMCFDVYNDYDGIIDMIFLFGGQYICYPKYGEWNHYEFVIKSTEIKSMGFWMHEHISGANAVLYLDNFHIEKTV